VYFQRLLKILGVSINLTNTFEVIFLSRLGKYIPGGGIWALLGQVYLFDKENISKLTVLIAIIMQLLVYSLYGILVFLIFYFFHLGLKMVIHYVALIFIFCIFVFILSPKIFTKIVNLISFKLKGERINTTYNYLDLIYLSVLCIKYRHKIKGHNSRLDEIQAAILRVKLKKLDKWNEVRRNIAGLYDQFLENSSVIKPKQADYAKHVYHLYTIRSRKRDALRTLLERSGIQTLIHYPIPIHMQEAYRDLGLEKGSYPNTERCANEILSLPVYSTLKKQDLEHISYVINRFGKRA
jgi:hypothetical protein